MIGLDDAGKWSDVLGAFAGGVRQRVEAERTVYGAGRDQHFAARAGGVPDRSAPSRNASVELRIRAGQAAYVAGRDQHFGNRRAR